MSNQAIDLNRRLSRAIEKADDNWGRGGSSFRFEALHRAALKALSIWRSEGVADVKAAANAISKKAGRVK